MFLYAITILVSAFLLFQVQPVIAKIILPWFGGSAAVWTSCLLFFQLALLLGYLYSHAVVRYLKPRAQMLTHGCLLLLSLFALPIYPSASWKPADPSEPLLRILGLLAVTVGLPYFLLSTTGPLLQAWYARRYKGAMPYRLYSLSNAGSMFALLSYPVLFEPTFATHRQATMWSIAYVAFVLLCGFVAFRSGGAPAPKAEASGEEGEKPGARLYALWLLLPACASALLLAVTNHLSQNVAAIPLLWVLPLSVYLLSFILCFESEGWYTRDPYMQLLAVALGCMAYSMFTDNAGSQPIKLTIPLFLMGLFTCCMVCHGELARLKPHPRYLTHFYLMISAGGAVGGVLVGLIAPMLFNAYYELPIGVVACGALAIIAMRAYLWAPAQRIVGEVAVQQTAVSDAEAHGQVPVSAPRPAAGRAAETPNSPLPPAIHWASLLLFGILTAGIFTWVWMFLQASYAKKLRPASKATLLYLIVGFFFVLMLMLDFSNSIGLTGFDALQAGISLLWYIVLICANFSLRRDLEEYYNSVEPIGLRLSRGMTFFFGLFYFQYHLNAIREKKSPGEPAWLRNLLPAPRFLAAVAALAGGGCLAYAERDWYTGKAENLAGWLRKGWEPGEQFDQIVLAATLVVLAALALAILRGDPKLRWTRKWAQWGAFGAELAAVVLAGYIGYQTRDANSGNRLMVRNFYGGLKVRDSGPFTILDATRTLTHGTINHGEQYLNPARQSLPTTYYGPNTGVGLAVRSKQAAGPIRLGVVGLGTGTMAAYGREGDYVRFYEINPLVLRMSFPDPPDKLPEFTFLRYCKAKREVAMGDARLSLEREAPENFDVLVVDAFSSDSIPVHLLTREAMVLFFHHLKPNGILAVHISNRYLDLEPVVLGESNSLGKMARTVDTDDDTSQDVFSATWVLVTSPAAGFDKMIVDASKPSEATRKVGLWTDDYSNLFQILK